MTRHRVRAALGAITAVLLAAPLSLVQPGAARAATALDWVLRADGLAAPTQVTSARDGKYSGPRVASTVYCPAGSFTDSPSAR